MNLSIKPWMAAGLIISLTGCAAHQQQNQMEAFNESWIAGDYLAAAAAMSAKTSLTGQAQDEDGRLLELLHQAEAHRMAGEMAIAIELYDQAETGMKLDDTTGLAGNLLEGGMAVLINDAERDYTPMLAEAVLVNTYKGLAFLQQGNAEYARIEFNRANDRTRRAVKSFAEEIESQRQALKEEESDEQQSIRQSLGSDALQQSVTSHYGETSQWSVFPEFIVPAATYLHGLYFLASGEPGDLNRAATSLGRVAKMAPENRALAADAQLAEQLAAGRRSRSAVGERVWVVYENGLGPVAEEIRFDVPLLLFHGNTYSPAYTGIALPRYADRAPVNDALHLVDGQGKAYPTEAFSWMGKVIHTEMQARFPAILGRAVASAAVKALIQNAATDELGIVGQLGSAVFAAATTQADLRSWQAIPHHWEVARLKRPESGQLTLRGNAGILGELTLPEWQYTLIYIKRPSAQGPAQVSLIDLQGDHDGKHLSLDGRARSDTLVADAS